MDLVAENAKLRGLLKMLRDVYREADKAAFDAHQGKLRPQGYMMSPLHQGILHTVNEALSQNSKLDLTIVWGSDWEGLYINGELEAQGHSISNHELLSIFGLEYKSVEADEDFLDETGYLPHRLKDVKLAEE